MARRTCPGVMLGLRFWPRMLLGRVPAGAVRRGGSSACCAPPVSIEMRSVIELGEAFRSAALQCGIFVFELRKRQMPG
jgi:hypothetical protein